MNQLGSIRMDGSDRIDDRTFRVNFSNDGITKLRECVNDKLKEFMGDYTDDTLVEYVIVLLRNGRRKEEAKKELNVFLGDDDSDSFVNWLWDHLSSNLHLYLPPQELFSVPGEVVKAKQMSEKQDPLKEQLSDSYHSDSDYDDDKSVQEFTRRRNREWKGLVRDVADPPPLRSSDIDTFHSEKPQQRSDRVNQNRSPRRSVHRKRKLQDEEIELQQVKKEVTSHRAIDAPRRLLQFAVRDAVGTPSRSSSSKPEPALKRLRSVVSTSMVDTLPHDQSKKMRSVAVVPHGVSTAIKAAAEAAQDVIKVRCSGNVFDRLGRAMVTSEATSQSLVRRANMPENNYKDLGQIPRAAESKYMHRNEYSEDLEDVMLDRGTVVTSDSASDNDGYNNVGIIRSRFLDASRTASSGNKDDDSLMVHYSVAKDPEDVIRKSRMNNQDMPNSSVANASRKIVNISVNVNTWKPPHYKAAREVAELSDSVAVPESGAGAGKQSLRQMKENNMVMPIKDTDVVRADSQNDVQKNVPSAPASYSTVRPLEDADSRTIFVSNVHFGATKDSLSRHFNKFGEVLKVIIMTDAATGQPKGSAYIEFMRKEAAEHALSLNGTSFMSRILKVVRRGSVHHEAAPMMTWPGMPRASSFAPRLARAPFPRAVPSALRARFPIKAGARSLQWKRDSAVAPTTSTGEVVASPQGGAVNLSNNVSSQAGRKLTYVRAESKQDGNV